MKSLLARALFKTANVRQIHIIGCSRSGTTMLHASMCAFEDVLLQPTETCAAQPGLKERTRILRRFRRLGVRRTQPKHFVTKRAYGWFQDDEIAALIRRVVREKVGIIDCVRDPRDVLLSRHASADRARYVTVQHWCQSIEAARRIREGVGAHVPVLAVRYEDLIEQPRLVENNLARTFGLRLRPGAEIDRVADNLASSGTRLSAYMATNMQGVRNADPKSLRKWLGSPDNPEAELLADANAAPLYRDFMPTHGYA